MSNPNAAVSGIRPNAELADTLADDSWAIHGGNRIDSSGAIQSPIAMATSYLMPDVPSLAERDPSVLLYSREGTVNTLLLQEKLAHADRGEAAVVFATGMAAIHAAFVTVLNPGDHVIAPSVAYVHTSGLFNWLLRNKLGVQVDVVDVADPEAVRAAVRPNTKVIYTEVMTNPTLRVVDIAALADIAHSVGAILIADSTFAPPPMFRPLEHGADLVIHSLTKYYNGHGDMTGGVAIGSKPLIDAMNNGPLYHAGGTMMPFSAWLVLRGSLTLPLRLQRHNANALVVAEFLRNDPRVESVVYPGLPDNPDHELATRQFTGGYGGLVSFTIGTSADDGLRLAKSMRMITHATSLGHPGTLVMFYDPVSEPAGNPEAEDFSKVGLLRLAIGLEDPADIIADLDAALTEVFGPAIGVTRYS